MKDTYTLTELLEIPTEENFDKCVDYLAERYKYQDTIDKGDLMKRFNLTLKEVEECISIIYK